LSSNINCYELNKGHGISQPMVDLIYSYITLCFDV